MVLSCEKITGQAIVWYECFIEIFSGISNIHPVIKDIRTGAIRRKDGSYSHNDIIYDDDKFLLVPHNGSVPPSEIYKEDIVKLYKVKGVLRGY